MFNAFLSEETGCEEKHEASLFCIHCGNEKTLSKAAETREFDETFKSVNEYTLKCDFDECDNEAAFYCDKCECLCAQHHLELSKMFKKHRHTSSYLMNWLCS